MKRTLLLFATASCLLAADTPVDRLRLYQGHWKGTRKAGDAPPVPIDIENQCGRIGTYFGCQQTVAGKLGAVVFYVPAEQPGHFYTQVILPDGQTLGRGELTIEGTGGRFYRSPLRRPDDLLQNDQRLQR
ncbi:MAG: hypothetical protein WDO73_08410 [Ignavibacteriota bacterium]